MKEHELQITSHDFLIYRDVNGEVKVNVMLINNDLWLTQDLIAELFGIARSTITEHINNIINDGELQEKKSTSLAGSFTLPSKGILLTVLDCTSKCSSLALRSLLAIT